MFLWCNHPSSCTEVNCLMLLASYVSLPGSLCLDPFWTRIAAPVCLLVFLSRHGTSSFLCWVQGWIVQLEHKTLFHGTPTMHLWTPCYAWTTHADPQRDTRAASWRAGRPLEFGDFGPRSSPSLPANQASPQDRKIFWQRLFPFSTYYDFVLFGTSVGFTLVQRDSWFEGKKVRLDRPNQSSIWRIWWCCNCTSCRAKMSLPLNKHTSSWLPVCCWKHARKSFLKHSKEEQWGGGGAYAVLKWVYERNEGWEEIFFMNFF